MELLEQSLLLCKQVVAANHPLLNRCARTLLGGEKPQN
jgi:hypothetical protein